jgi:ketosteroid isomerase-like protein
MSQRNVDVVHALYEGWAKGDFRAGADLLDSEFAFVLRPEFPDAGVYHGPEGMRDYMRLFLAAWNNLTITPTEFIEADGSLIVAVHQRGIGRESGIATELRYYQIWTFRGRAIIRLEGVRTRAEAFEAVGLQA